jgi:glutaredoxin
MDYIFPSPRGFTVYSKSGCRYCTLVKEIIKNENMMLVDCDDYLVENKEGFLAYIYQLTGVNYRTFPMVFHEGRFLGGFTETKKWIEQRDAFMDTE